MLFYGTTTKGMGKCCCDSGEAADVGWNDHPSMLPYDGRASQYPRQDPMTLPGDRSRRNGYPYNDNQYNRYGNGTANQERFPGDMRQIGNRGGNNLDGSSLGRNDEPYRNRENHTYGRDNASPLANRRDLNNDHRNYPFNQSKGGGPTSSSNLLPPQSNLSRHTSPQSTPNVSPGSSPNNRGHLPSLRPSSNERPLDSNANARGPATSSSKNDVRSRSPKAPALPTLPKPAFMREQSKPTTVKKPETNTRTLTATADAQKQAQSSLSRSRSPAAKEARTGNTNSKPAKKAEGKKRETASDDEEGEDVDADAKSVKSQTKKSTTSRSKGITGNATKEL